jgi:hypothetical protein
MNRKLLIQLLQDGLHYTKGKHRVWVSKCFEITVRPDRIVELDEYEGYTEESGVSASRKRPLAEEAPSMYHVGRSVIHLKDGRVVAETGTGWEE